MMYVVEPRKFPPYCAHFPSNALCFQSYRQYLLTDLLAYVKPQRSIPLSETFVATERPNIPEKQCVFATSKICYSTFPY